MLPETEAEIEQEQLPKQLRIRRTFDVDLFDYFLWCAVLIIFFDPFLRSLVGVQEGQHQILCRFMRKNVAFYLYCTVSYSYSFFVFLIFHKVLGMQPRVRDLQRNEALIIGYIFILTGLCIKAYIYFSTPIIGIMAGQHFNLDTMPRKIGHIIYDPFYHPLGTSSVMCYFGYSVVRASAAGIILTITLGLAYCAASQLERNFLSKAKKQILEPYASTPADCSLSDTDDQKNKQA